MRPRRTCAQRQIALAMITTTETIIMMVSPVFR
jgi:hypothetical protein